MYYKVEGEVLDILNVVFLQLLERWQMYHVTQMNLSSKSVDLIAIDASTK